MQPHNVPFALLGASSAVVRLVRFQRRFWGPQTGRRLRVHHHHHGHRGRVPQLAPDGAVPYGKATTVGAASGAVAGLVAITGGLWIRSPLGAIAVGVFAGIVCPLAVGLKSKFGFDDSLDVVGVHLVGGIIGTVFVGLFGLDHGALAGGVESKRGLFYGGGGKLLLVQIAAAVFGARVFLRWTLIIGSILSHSALPRHRGK